jgi:hypothetical protein
MDQNSKSKHLPTVIGIMLSYEVTFGLKARGDVIFFVAHSYNRNFILSVYELRNLCLIFSLMFRLCWPTIFELVSPTLIVDDTL